MTRRSAIDRTSMQDDFAFGTDSADALPYFRSIGASRAAGIDRAAAAASPSLDDQVAFLNGINSNGRLTSNSFWGANGMTAYKWGESTLGTGATITYYFDTSSRFTVNEKNTFLKAFAMWSSVADVTFVQTRNADAADVLLQRGDDGGAYNITPSSNGSGRTPGAVTGQALISVDTSVPGFDLSGSLDLYGGYGMSTIIHEVGHLLGLGHGGAYNGNVDPATEQYSAYDDRMYTIMSYVNWTNYDAKYIDENPIPGTDWGYDDSFNYRTAPHTMMGLDILAIQQLYGAADKPRFDGGEVYGFNSNITGKLADFYDFTVNTSPVITIYNQGDNNTIDISGWSMYQYLDLTPASFSSVGGLSNNLFVSWDTNITHAIGGSGNDFIISNDIKGDLEGGLGDDELWGGAGADLLQGGAGDDLLYGQEGKDRMIGGIGADLFWFETARDSGRTKANADVIVDFISRQNDKIYLADIDPVPGGVDNDFTFIGRRAFTGDGAEIRFTVANGDTTVFADVNGDRKVDFAIVLEGVTNLSANDFVL